MPTKTHPMRLPDDLVAAARAKGDTLRMTTLTACVIAALTEWADPASRSNREAGLERRLEAAERELGRLTAELGEDKAGDRLIAALGNATPQRPVVIDHLAAVTGWSQDDWLMRILTVLARDGYVTRVRRGWYAPVPGADLREGLAAAREQSSRGAARISPGRRGTADGSSPAPPPASPPADGTRTAEGKNAATGGQEPRDARTERAGGGKQAPAQNPALLAAKNSRRPAAAKFQPGPDVDCLHENMRGVKGVCPDCMQWVTR